EALAQPAIEVDSRPVHLARPPGQQPGPGDREPVRVYPQAGYQVDVLLHPVVVVDGDVAGLAPGGLAGEMREGVPHRRATATFGHGTLDLVGGGGYAPHEVRRESVFAHTPPTLLP